MVLPYMSYCPRKSTRKGTWAYDRFDERVQTRGPKMELRRRVLRIFEIEFCWLYLRILP